MSDIFLSYASEDVTRASHLARALMRQGWSVWWDRSILPGKVFDTVIEAELSAAKCVIVLWSTPSVESRWVRAEAGEALDKGRLIPVLLDEVVIPLVFRQVQAASLIGWDGDDAHAGFQNLLKAITAFVPPQPVAASQHDTNVSTQTAATVELSAEPVADHDRADKHRRNGLWMLAMLVISIVLAVTTGVYYEEPAVDSKTETLQQDLVPELIDASPVPQSATKPGTAHAESIPEPTRSAPPPAPVEAKPPQREMPAVKYPAPVAVKPARESPAPQAKPAPETVAKAEPAPAAATPLTILTVAWAMPNDNGVASAANVKKYSASLSKMMATVVRAALRRPLAFDYYYPSQQDYYRLLKDANDHAASKKLCGTHKADLVIAGFVKGAEFVSTGYGYALTRNPVFSVFDCKVNKKTTQTYQVAENVDDRFPFEKATTTAFRTFVHKDAALAKR